MSGGPRRGRFFSSWPRLTTGGLPKGQAGARVQPHNPARPPARTGLEELRQGREALDRKIAEETAEQARIQADIDVPTARLQQVTASLAKKVRGGGGSAPRWAGRWAAAAALRSWAPMRHPKQFF